MPLQFLTPAPQTDDHRTEDLWLPLQRAFDEILDKHNTNQDFDQLYKDAYAMVIRNEGERLYCGLREAVQEHLVNKVRPLMLAKVHDCLWTINQAWEDHQTSMEIISDIVKYLDHTYVPQNNVCCVKELGVLLFRDVVANCGVVRYHLRDTMLGLVKMEREGNPVDRVSLKKACEMLVALGLGSMSFYEEYFEKPFLVESAQFYALRGQRYIGTRNSLEYVAQVEEHVKKSRSGRCSVSTSQPWLHYRR
ncbi:hypothetical protein HPB51_001062 [Rhipicephalus microplus]|uniref:Cullin N-terminal domain-containing protein n=1 Tax=Rhipicephalus microplus TaxID=6941 RepID=A0A9J6DRX7_RHIMP|nr:hypothetical protein HPB51_001062 [Rhipicephalus microplus]